MTNNSLIVLAIIFLLYILFGTSKGVIENYYPYWRNRLSWYRRNPNRWWWKGPVYNRFRYFPYYNYY